MYVHKVGWRKGSRSVHDDGEHEDNVARCIYHMFLGGVPVMLLRLVYIVMMCKEIPRSLDGAEIFSGSECIVNGLRYFRLNVIPFEILRDPVPLESE